MNIFPQKQTSLFSDLPKKGGLLIFPKYVLFHTFNNQIAAYRVSFEIGGAVAANAAIFAFGNSGQPAAYITAYGIGFKRETAVFGYCKSYITACAVAIQLFKRCGGAYDHISRNTVAFKLCKFTGGFYTAAYRINIKLFCFDIFQIKSKTALIILEIAPPIMKISQLIYQAPVKKLITKYAVKVSAQTAPFIWQASDFLFL